MKREVEDKIKDLMSLRKEGDEVFNEALDASIDKLEEIIKFVMKI